jgi:hypothetical protein
MPLRTLAAVSAVLIASAFVRAAEQSIDFNRDVKPILAKNCFACHGPDDSHREGNLRLDRRDGAVKVRKDGGAAVVPGKPSDSRLVERVTAKGDEDRMPPPEAGDRLKPEQVAILKRWIESGANYSEHWSLVKPRRPILPPLRDEAWPRHGMDHFILSRLEREGMKPSGPADKFVLLRRASLDLRGLPPTPQEVDEFAKDSAPDAYEKMVDRFLADPAYGERWARVWLDLARYADSAGYGSDPLRPNMWRYRDWVIDAFNKNQSYDRFTIEQIAGDLLPNSTLEKKIATAFHRNTMTNTEGGTDDEEFRVVAVKDRVDTTMQVWMGLTIGCAKCHNHKYDPFTQKEYYRLYAIFNQTADADRADEAPTIPAPSHEQLEQIRTIDAQLAALKKKLDAPSPDLEAVQAKWEAEMRLATPATSPVKWSAYDGPRDGPKVQAQPDGSVKLSASVAGENSVTLPFTAGSEQVTGFRLEVLPEDRSVDGFTLHEFGASVRWGSGPPVGRYVRVELPGKGKILSLAEVQVFRGGTNVAPKGTATQSSTDFEGAAKRAIDGNTDGDYQKKSTTHTKAESDPWWEVKLADAGPVESIVVWNRTDGGSGARLANFRVLVLDESRKLVWQSDVKESPSPSRELESRGGLNLDPADAYATTARDGTSAGGVLHPHGDRRTGWSPDPRAKGPHSIVFLAEFPFALPKGSEGEFALTFEGRGRIRIDAVTDANVSKRLALTPDVRGAIDEPADRRTADQRATAARHYRTIAPALQTIRDEIAKLEKARPQPAMLPIMQELAADKRRTTRMLVKGDFLNPADPVEPGVPSSLPPLRGASPDRLALAKWLVSPENPLTARVAANRDWAQLFGKGLVETEEDFGTQGELPSHPELLDWLATEYVRLGWDTKAFLKMLVTSSTYRQSAKVTPEQLSKDPKNRYYGRAPRFRLEAEMVRDQALALSGLLSRKIEPLLRPGTAIPPRSRDGARPGAGAIGIVEQEDWGAERVPAATAGALAGGVQRPAHLAD